MSTINGATTQFLYDGLNPVQELDGANPPSVTANLLTGLGVDEYFARTDSSGTMAFLRDALGSTIGLVNSAGSIGTSYAGACPERSRRKPFGNTTVSGPSANALQFTGRENDGTGLYYFRARYYSPTLQRFVSQDPIGFLGGDTNLYGFVSDDPGNLTDPSGKTIFPPRPGDVFPPLDISCSKVGGWLGSAAGVVAGLGIGSLFPPAAPEGFTITEPLLGGIFGGAAGAIKGNSLLGRSGLCTPNPAPQTCPIRP